MYKFMQHDLTVHHMYKFMQHNYSSHEVTA